MERMFKYGMVNVDKCQRCGEKETYKHLLWECVEAKRVRERYSNFVCKIGCTQARTNRFDEIFIACDNGALRQEMILARWCVDNANKNAREIKCI